MSDKVMALRPKNAVASLVARTMKRIPVAEKMAHPCEAEFKSEHMLLFFPLFQ